MCFGIDCSAASAGFLPVVGHNHNRELCHGKSNFLIDLKDCGHYTDSVLTEFKISSID